MAIDIRQEITDRIIKAMEEGKAFWQKPWTSPEGLNPVNADSNRAYSGINRLLLSMSGYQDDRWMTFNQASKAGYQIKKGEKATQIIFAKTNEYEKKTVNNQTGQEETELSKAFTLRYFHVFNAEQIAGIPPKDITLPNKVADVERAEELILNLQERTGLKLEFGGGKACYIPSIDTIKMPVKEAFHTTEGFYSTLLHESAHATLHESRLDRKDAKGTFGSPTYAMEELRAEISSAMVCAELGIPMDEDHIKQHAAYLDSWLSALKQDKYEIFRATRDANKITDYLIEHAPKLEQSQEITQVVTRAPVNIRQPIAQTKQQSISM